MPAPPEPPPPPPEPPKETDEEVKRARGQERKMAMLAAGRSSTIKTGGRGLTSQATLQKKSLLGQ